MNVTDVQLVENITFIRVVLYGIEIWSVERNLDFSAHIVLRNQNGSLTLQPTLNVNICEVYIFFKTFVCVWIFCFVLALCKLCLLLETHVVWIDWSHLRGFHCGSGWIVIVIVPTHLGSSIPRKVTILGLIELKMKELSYAYWTVHHLDIWIKVDQLDDTCFIIYCSTCFRR